MGFIMFVALLLVLSTIILGIVCIKRGLKGQKVKKFLGVNILSMFLMLIAVTAFFLTGGTAMAQGTTVANTVSGNGLAFIAAALSTGLATIGAGIAVSASAAAALGAISEEPKLLGKTLIFVGLAEGIAIYGLIVSILILGKM